MTLPILLRCYLGITAVMSVITLLVFALDKVRSMIGIRLGPFKLSFNRVPEKTLLTLSFFGGSLGAMLGMLIFRHKSRKNRFRIWIPVHLLIWVLIGLAVIEYGPAVTEAVRSMI
ncbi:MAG: DUF1294 domain-containing protein [Ruminococcus sp.]|nr:DUF1294 domain-containing protein [Ruminococcus sp.]